MRTFALLLFLSLILVLRVQASPSDVGEVMELNEDSEQSQHPIEQMLNAEAGSSDIFSEDGIMEDWTNLATLHPDTRIRSYAALIAIFAHTTALLYCGHSVETLYVCHTGRKVSCELSRKPLVQGLIISTISNALSIFEFFFLCWRRRVTVGLGASAGLWTLLSSVMIVVGLAIVPDANEMAFDNALPSMLLQSLASLLAVLSAFFLNS